MFSFCLYYMCIYCIVNLLESDLGSRRGNSLVQNVMHVGIDSPNLVWTRTGGDNHHLHEKQEPMRCYREQPSGYSEFNCLHAFLDMIHAYRIKKKEALSSFWAFFNPNLCVNNKKTRTSESKTKLVSDDEMIQVWSDLLWSNRAHSNPYPSRLQFPKDPQWLLMRFSHMDAPRLTRRWPVWLSLRGMLHSATYVFILNVRISYSCNAQFVIFPSLISVTLDLMDCFGCFLHLFIFRFAKQPDIEICEFPWQDICIYPSVSCTF